MRGNPFKVTCLSCPYWAEPAETALFQGECRIRSVQIVLWDESHFEVWPLRTEEDWCGEHPMFNRERVIPS